MAAVPQAMQFQGRLANLAGTPTQTTVPITFRLYAAAAGGGALWTEVQPNVTTDTEGLYSVLLGSITSFASAGLTFDTGYYLTVDVNGEGEMSPRQFLAMMPFAYRAHVADSIAKEALNLPKGLVVDGSTLYVDTVSNRVGINTASPQYTLSVGGDAYVTGVVYAGNVLTNQFKRATTPLMWTDQFDSTGKNGVLIANNESEEGGFWANGEYNCVYGPGDNDLVKFCDEDYFNNAGTVYDNNAMRARIDGSGNWFTISDSDVKENIVRIDNALARLGRLHGYTYSYRQNERERQLGAPIRRSAGVTAQEVREALPEAMSESDGALMVNYAALVPILIEAIKEQQRQIEELTRRAEALERR